MLISKSRLRQIIKEELLKEVGLRDSPRDDYVTTVASGFEPPPQTDSTAIAKLILGFTPAGVAIDAYDMYRALVERDPELLALATVGFIPGVGDLKKADLDDIVEELGTEGMSQIRRQADDAARVAARTSRTARISEPVIETLDDGSFLKAKYTVGIDDASYDVIFAKKSHGAPIDISFNVAGQGTEYAMTDARHPLRLVSGVTDTFKDLRKRFPDEKSFQFTGYIGEADRLNFGAGGDQVSKRTKVFNGLIQRALRRDSSIEIERMGDLSWAGDPNTIKITLKELRRITRELILSEVGLRDSPRDDYVTTVAAGFDPPPKTDSTLIAKLILGFTPVGLAFDAYDMYKALIDRDTAMFALATVGFVPGIGDLKGLTRSDLDDVVQELGPDGMRTLKNRADAARATGQAASRASRTARTIASEIPWADKKLWILRGNDRGFTGAHQVVGLKNNQGQTFLFYKSSGSNIDEYGNLTTGWLRFHGFTPKPDGAGGGYFRFIKDRPGAKTNPPPLQRLADQLNELDNLTDSPGIADIKGLLPDFKIKSITDDFTREGVEDIAEFNKWANSIGATTPHALKQGLPGVNISAENLIDMFNLK